MTAPSRKDRLRPLEYLVLSAIIAGFVGIVVLLSTRQITLSLIFFGITFIVSLVTIAMLALAIKPGPDEKNDLEAQDREQGSGH